MLWLSQRAASKEFLFVWFPLKRDRLAKSSALLLLFIFSRRVSLKGHRRALCDTLGLHRLHKTAQFALLTAISLIALRLLTKRVTVSASGIYSFHLFFFSKLWLAGQHIEAKNHD